MPRELRPCGTVAAYERHRRSGEEPCDACREAKRLYSLDYYTPRKRELQPCGTAAAYQRHLAHGEEACRPCKDAVKALKAKMPGTPRKQAKCGTDSGYTRHRQRGETPCQACRDARAEAQRKYRASLPKPPGRRQFNRMLAEVWAEVNDAA